MAELSFKVKGLIILLLFLRAVAMGQKVSGSVTNDMGTPLPNVNIIVAGAIKGTFTDSNGRFEMTINHAKDKVLLFSHVGYGKVDLPIPPSNKINLKLETYYEPLPRLNLDPFPQVFDPNTVISLSETANQENAIETDVLALGGWDLYFNTIGNALAKVSTQEDIFIKFTVSNKGVIEKLKLSDSTQTSASTLLNILRKLPGFIPATQRRQPVAQHFSLVVGHGYTKEDISIVSFHFYNYLGNVLQYPAEARKSRTEGIVYAFFKIDADGRIKENSIIAEPGNGCGDEVKIVVSMIPRETARAFVAVKRSNVFLLPIAFGLGKPFSGETQMPTTQGTVLETINVVAHGGGIPKN